MTAFIRRGLVIAQGCNARTIKNGIIAATARDVHPTFLTQYGHNRPLHHQQQMRWNTIETENSEVIYRSPMGDLITRLKIVSITSCVMSVVGLPLFVALKNGSLPTPQQLGLGGVAFLGATGSTVALHFVFGPYILTMEKIPVRLCHFVKSDAEGDDENDRDGGSNSCKDSKVSEDKAVMLKATTRSVFGWRNELVFDPLTDVSFYTGSRPFANFVAKGVTLYAHPEMLNEDLRLLLLAPRVQPKEEASKVKDDDDSFV